ncbi:MAG: hypothetical protein DCF20_01485 [Pseudanabaena sp.]|nr:MAG: hypothetical protein DCF20_01485 [Pseudanabaena sp.]
MKFSTSRIFLALLLAIFSASAFPLDELFARGGGRSGGGGTRTGASPRVNSGTNLQNRGNINTSNVNRGNVNTSNVNRGNVNTSNVNRGNVNTSNVNRGNVNTSNVNRGNVNTGNVNVNVGNVNVNTGWRGGGWNGRGYATPPGWGLAAFATGLVIGAALTTPPPYYIPIFVGDTRFIYSDGVFLEPSGSSYIVVKPPIGAIVPSIPDGCSTLDIGGVVHYDCSGVIYQPFFQGSDLVYKIVSY